jgi:FkbH-like protein
MELIEALRILATPASKAAVDILLATGFQPLHLKTFVAARVRQAFPDRQVKIHTGLYGDLLGTLKAAVNRGVDGTMVVIEWSDLDPRLGLRSLGGWGPRDLEDILDCAGSRAGLLEDGIREIALRRCIAVSLPTLPLPPASFAPRWEASNFELQLREGIFTLVRKLSQSANIHIVSGQRLDCLSPPAGRLNVSSELLCGFPYTLTHADIVAELLTLLVQAKLAKKGLITDLDDTLWAGIAAEDGPESVSWDLDRHSQMHGVYQQVLRSLAESGVLIAAASKNDNQVVANVFRRKDLILPEKLIYPMEIHWRPKSESVGRILKLWNVGPDSVVFVDDSAMEIAEVKRVFPELECLQFPCGQDGEVYQLLEELRDLFGKSTISEEDRVRLETIRNREQKSEQFVAGGTDADEFPEEIEGQIDLDFTKCLSDTRALDLVNKTNQFKLNGNRYTKGAWLEYMERPETILVVASYRDRYGPLGRIAVITGHLAGDTLHVENWVMSCRAFARRIEYRCLSELAARYAVKNIAFNFVPTTRNGPIQNFLSKLLGKTPESFFVLDRDLAMKCSWPLDLAQESRECEVLHASAVLPSSA